MMIGKYAIAARTLALIAGIIALVVLAMWVPSCIQKQRSVAAQARTDAAQAGAAQNSAADAIAVQGAANERQINSEATTRSNERTIRDAQGANDAVNPAVRNAGFDSLCRRASFRNSPSGKLRCHIAADMETRR